MGLRIWSVMLGLMLWSASSPSKAQIDLEIQEMRERMLYEPSVAELARAALRYFRVDPKAFDNLRKTAKTRAWLPTLALGYRHDDNAFTQHTDDIGMPTVNRRGTTSTKINSASVGGVWDLRELVFNPSEVQVYGLIGVQRDIMIEVTRIYYLRKQLLIRFLHSPPADPLGRAALLLRMDEYVSLMDVLTGGWFTRTTDRRIAQARRRGTISSQGADAAGEPPQ